MNFKEGDVVQIMDYEEIVANFTDSDGYLHVPHGWDVDMKYLCGQTVTIKQIYGTSFQPYIRSQEGIENDRPGPGFWYVSTKLLKPIEPEPIAAVDESSFLGMLMS